MDIALETTGLDVNTAKKDSIFERLNKRNKDRQNYFDVKLEQRSKENLDLEGADYFSRTFTDRVQEIEANIRNVSDSATCYDKIQEKTEIVRVFASITLDIRELQRYLTNSTIFLTDYKIKACQSILNDLTARCEEKRLLLLPKKKFGFNSKKVTPKVTVNPKVNVDTVDFSEQSSISAAVFSWTLSNKTDECIQLKQDEVNGQDITISNMNNCLVEINGHAGSVQISNASNCTFLCGPISRSLFAENCTNSALAVACQQLRFHSSAGCKINLHVTCRAIIEDCKQIEISPYTYEYDGIDTDFQKAGLDKFVNNYKDIADFNWLSPDVPSPNWKLSTSDCIIDWTQIRQKFKEKLTL